jgi:hypothetical protein
MSFVDCSFNFFAVDFLIEEVSDFRANLREIQLEVVKLV